METARATICVSVDSDEETRSADAWFAEWRDKLNYVSDDRGCGCCVNIFDVEGPARAIDAIPSAVRSSSEWAGPYDAS